MMIVMMTGRTSEEIRVRESGGDDDDDGWWNGSRRCSGKGDVVGYVAKLEPKMATTTNVMYEGESSEN
ncbi:hypothetical protein TWF281_007411 [Arthrobotrys megalospora]